MVTSRYLRMKGRLSLAVPVGRGARKYLLMSGNLLFAEFNHYLFLGFFELRTLVKSFATSRVTGYLGIFFKG